MPVNRMIVNGTDLYDAFGLVFSDDYSMPLPEFKPYTVDIPGGDGLIDLTEFSGDVRYSRRAQKFNFFILPGMSQLQFEQIKTRVAAFLHGHYFSYELAIDPGYTYMGRFSISSDTKYENDIAFFTIEVDAEPYKSKGLRTICFNAAGGVRINIQSGRKLVCPTVEVQRKTEITHDGVTYTLDAGAYRINDLWLHEGSNILAIDTLPEYSHATWAYYAGDTWNQYTGKLMAYLAQGDAPVQVPNIWTDYAGSKWDSLETKTWVDLSHPAQIGDEYSVYMQFEWLDI